MPTYSYRCDHCDHAFERFQKFSEDAITVCPECGTEAVRRMFYPAGIIFKGTGWYVTDSRSKSSTTQPVNTSTETTTSTSKNGSKPESSSNNTKDK